jgi:hypothetical protein
MPFIGKGIYARSSRVYIHFTLRAHDRTIVSPKAEIEESKLFP